MDKQKLYVTLDDSAMDWKRELCSIWFNNIKRSGKARHIFVQQALFISVASAVSLLNIYEDAGTLWDLILAATVL